MVDNMLRSSNKVGIRVDYIYKLIIHSLLFPLRLGLLVVYTRFTMTLSATYANGCWLVRQWRRLVFAIGFDAVCFCGGPRWYDFCVLIWRIVFAIVN